MKPTIMLFAKAPLPGLAKTRLIPLLGADGAAHFAEACLCDLLRRLSLPFTAQPTNLHRLLFFSPAEARPIFQELLFRHSLQQIWELAPQVGMDLGGRLKLAQSWATQSGFGPICYLGMDCPHLPDTLIAAAFRETLARRAAIVRASDGGYVLLALPAATPSSVFDRIAWSTSHTASEQIQRVAEHEIEISTLNASVPLEDIDEPAALPALHQRLIEQPSLAPLTLAFLNARH